MPYTPHTKDDINSMLEAIGIENEEALFENIPKELRAKSFNLPKGKSEFEVYDELKKLSNKNRIDKILFMGGGYYEHIVPAVVDALSMRSEFYTAYTPYQAEASQGTLQALYEYQSLICRLFDMDVTNASMYDGGSALCEAALMAIRIRRRQKVVVDSGVNPIYKEMLNTYLKTRGFEVIFLNSNGCESDKEEIYKSVDEKTACYIFQNPNFFGSIEDYEEIIEFVHSKKTLAVGSFYPVALGLLKSPGEMGVDIATAEGQSLGNYLSFGGPGFGIIATKREFIRQLPGRIVAKTVDKEGKTAFVLTLQAREQHIRREKATSNICSNQNLMALRAAIFLTSLGKEGFEELSLLNLSKANYLKEELRKIEGIEIKNKTQTFNEFVIKTPLKAEAFLDEMAKKGIYGGINLENLDTKLKNQILVTVTEVRDKEQLDRYAKCVREIV